MKKDEQKPYVESVLGISFKEEEQFSVEKLVELVCKFEQKITKITDISFTTEVLRLQKALEKALPEEDPELIINGDGSFVINMKDGSTTVGDTLSQLYIFIENLNN